MVLIVELVLNNIVLVEEQLMRCDIGRFTLRHVATV